jgi:hypothetical protein
VHMQRSPRLPGETQRKCDATLLTNLLRAEGFPLDGPQALLGRGAETLCLQQHRISPTPHHRQRRQRRSAGAGEAHTIEQVERRTKRLLFYAIENGQNIRISIAFTLMFSFMPVQPSSWIL